MKMQILKDVDVDTTDIVSRSPVRNIPGAIPILAECIAMSMEHWVGEVDGVQACAWGICAPTVLSERAYLWLITTDLVDEHKFIFVRHSQRFIETALKRYPVIVGHCVADEYRSIRWLKWLGAVFREPEGKRIPFMIKRLR